MSVHEDLQHLEESLLDPTIRHDRSRLESLLAPNFREFGSSGRVFDRAAIIESLLAEPPGTLIQLTDFAIQPLTPDTVLATYRAHRDDRHSLRSSIWQHREGHWRMLFHQGTPIPVN